MSDLDDEIDRLVEEEAAREEEELLELEAELEDEELEAELEDEELEAELEDEEEQLEEAEEKLPPPRLTEGEKKALPILPVYELVKEYVTAALTEAFETASPELKFLLPESLDLEEAIESYTNLVVSSLRYGTTYALPVQRRVDFIISYLTGSM